MAERFGRRSCPARIDIPAAPTTLGSAAGDDAMPPPGTSTPPAQGPEPAAGPAPRGFDRQLALALLLAAAVVVPRSLLIVRAHSETYDEQYHLERGLSFWNRSIAAKGLLLNDPPLGEGLLALPMLATNLLEGRAPDDPRLYDATGRAERVSAGVAAWGSAMFLAAVGLGFAWCRRLYGARAAWLVAALLVLDPNFAAHAPIASLDVLGATGIVAACFLVWRYFERPTPGRLLGMGVGIGAALMLKHTAMPLPLLVLASAALWWVVRPWRAGEAWASWRSALPGRVAALAALGPVVVLTIWALTLFDVSPPISPIVSDSRARTIPDPPGPSRQLRLELERSLHLHDPWPAGIYLRALRVALWHGSVGHEALLFGERRMTGWWYYYPAVATFKVPIGVAAVFLLALLSLRRAPPRWAEWGLLIPLAVWAAFLMNNPINIGFRHFLPAYALLLMLAGRSVAGAGRLGAAAAWSAVAAAGLHAASYHPDYLSYVNFPRRKPHLSISDSNLDWGQGLKQVRDWLDAHPQRGRTVWLFYFGDPGPAWDFPSVRYYLGDRVALNPPEPLPTRGLLILSPVFEAAAYNASKTRVFYDTLAPLEPDAIIGHSLLVYDLDRLGAGRPFRWDVGAPPRQDDRGHAPEAPGRADRRREGLLVARRQEGAGDRPGPPPLPAPRAAGRGGRGRRGEPAGVPRHGIPRLGPRRDARGGRALPVAGDRGRPGARPPGALAGRRRAREGVRDA
jgi:hypothetical protein